MKKWMIGLASAVVLAGVGVWAYGSLGRRSVVVAAPERREAVRAVYATGEVKAEQIANLRPEVGGEVLQVAVKQGAEIRQGEAVMEIAVREEEDAVREQSARVKEASIVVEDARQALDKEQALLEQGATTQQAVDDAKNVYERAAASLRTIQSTLTTRKSLTAKGKITSPITGIVTKVNVSVGDVVPANADAVTILDPFSFKVYAEIDELDINRVKPGQEAIVAFDAAPDARYRARVERIIPAADAVRKTIPVVLHLTDVVPNLSNGLTATVNIVQERRPDALTIPAAALVDEKNGNAVVWIVDDHNRLARRTIKVGVKGEDYVEVIEGLRENERVVLDPEEGWKEGDEVEIDREKMRENIRS